MTMAILLIPIQHLPPTNHFSIMHRLSPIKGVSKLPHLKKNGLTKSTIFEDFCSFGDFFF